MNKLMNTIEQVFNGRRVTINAYQDLNDPDFGDFDESDFHRKAYESGDMIQTIIEVDVWHASGELSGTNTVGGYLLWASDLETQVEDRVNVEGFCEEANDDLERKLQAILDAN